MKTQLLKVLTLLVTFSLILTGCDGLKKMVKNHPTMSEYTTTPDPLEMHNDEIVVNMKGTYKPKYFNKKADVIIQPELQYEGGSVLLKPMLLKGEAVQGEGTSISNANGGEFTYTDKVPYTPEMENATLVVNPAAFMAAKAKENMPETAEEAMAVKGAKNLGEKEVASGTNVTPSRIQKEAKPAVADNKYEKETIIPQTASIYYLVNQYNLDWNWKMNKKAESKQLIADMTKAFDQGMEIKSVEIPAWASPEGEETRNADLAENRAKTAEKYIKNVYDKAIQKQARKQKVKVSSLKKDFPINIQGQGEDVEGFLSSVKASKISDKDKIVNVVGSLSNRDAREREIVKMMLIYNEIENDIMPPLRRATITVNFLEPKKTDEEIALLATTTPDSLKANELLYAATLTEDMDTKLSIYEAATAVYAEDYRGYNNLAYIQILKKDYDAAQTALNTANGLESNNAEVLNNLGVVALAKGEFKDAKAYFESASAAGSAEAKQNLGILSIKEGNYAAAQTALENDKCTYNLGLSQLLAKNVDAAKATLQCAPQDAQTIYLLAVCAARGGNAADVVNYLKQAIELDATLKEQAKKDVEFKKFRENDDFVNLLN